MRIKHLILCLLLFLSLKSEATHIVGGEIYYDCLGGNNYKITLKIYRDCFLGTAPYDDPATIFIFNSSGALIDSVGIPFPGSNPVPATINNPCYSAPVNICVEEAIYETTLNLPPIAGGYDIAYQRCCRNNSIINIISPGNVGATYMAHIPGPSLATCNSSPRYNHFPPIFICVGVPLIFDNSASDLNGDSLYYELCDAYVGLDPTCPIAGAAAGVTCPNVIPPPPYAFVPWSPPYSGTYPMSSSPALAINHQTGLITGTPNMIGQWVVAVCVSEYRNGVLLDVNKRDFQFNVTNCPIVSASVIPSQTTFCFGYTVNFFNTSINAFTYHWDFGDPSTTADTSNISSPTWTYADSGTYVVTLTINMGTPCSASGQTTFYIYPLLAPAFVPPPGQCEFANSYSFACGGSYLGNGTFNWTFAGGLPAASTLQNPVNIVYGSAGTYPVTITITENGCTQSYTDSVIVYQKPNANYGRTSDTACDLQPVYFIDSSSGDAPFTYHWTFGDGTTSTAQNPSHIYPSVGSYLSNVIILSAHGCKDTFSLASAVTVYPTPVADFIVTPRDTSIFYPVVTMVDRSIGATFCQVNWGDGTGWVNNCDSSRHTYSKPGHYEVVQVVKNMYGCYDTARYLVIIEPEFIFWIPNAFTPFNGDNLNSVFKPKLLGVHNYSFMIFDRWGEKLFETEDPDTGWDGIYKGKPCEPGVYVYKINFIEEVKSGSRQYIGSVTIVQ